MINKDVVKSLAVQSGAAVGVTHITDTDHDMTHFTPDELLVFANAIAAHQHEQSASIFAFKQAALQKEVKQLKQRLYDLKAAARRVVADTLAAEPKLCITEKPRGCATPRACSALAQIDDLGMRIESLVWATVLRLNKALVADEDLRL